MADLTADEQLVADEIARCDHSVRGDLLAELPVAEAAAFLREETLRGFTGEQRFPARASHGDLGELSIMVQFHRLRQRRPSLHRLHFPDDDGPLPRRRGRTVEEEFVQEEIDRLRDGYVTVRRDRIALATAQADLLENAPPNIAARFLREQALCALAGSFDRDPWAMSQVLKHDVFREEQAARKLGTLRRIRESYPPPERFPK